MKKFAGSSVFGCLLALVPAMTLAGSQPAAQSVTLDVEGPNGEAVGGYRWLLEEDRTRHVTPGVPDPDSLSFHFATSYMPIADQGHASGAATIPVDPTKAYFVSVLPDSGYTLSGGSVLPGQTSLTVVVNAQPVPTAQISVFAFHDNAPTNGVPSLPAEAGLAGFQVLVEDTVAAGQLLFDAFGNRLGTTYNADGSVDQLGDGLILTDENGEAVIQNLYPGKYGIQIVPPVGQDWVQTSTLEGKKTIDAFVKANEPPFFVEFGPPGHHVEIGFVQPHEDSSFFSGPTTVSGRIVNLHLSRPPLYTFSKGVPLEHTRPIIAINDGTGATGTNVYVGRANEDGSFAISGFPPGTYQMVVFDEQLDFVISISTITIPPATPNLDLGDVGVFQWFARMENHVFFDANEDGVRDPGEPGMLEQAINLRFRDGTIYQSFPTDLDGFVPFDQVFPFFHWLVAEVDFARFKATGMTTTVDAGGEIAPNDPFSFGGILTPQLQPDNGNAPFRTETGPVLTQGFQTFLGQTSVIEWGKANYAPGENGGISGIVFYGVTRAEDNPALAAAETWEPGIPRVVMNLYQDEDADGVVDDLDGDGGPTLADNDNYPFGNFPGLEDVDRNGNGVHDAGDALQTTTTDSWDDNPPSGCPGDPNDPFYQGGKGYDGLRAWNQVRPAVFDGGYAFFSYFPGGMASGSAEVEGLLPGTYIVEAVPPRGEFGSQTYVTMAEEHKNVDFGDEYAPALRNLPPPAVGDLHLVPSELELFPGVPAPFAGQLRPLADRKKIQLFDGQNAAVDFWMCTSVPPAAHVTGFVLNDLANEFDPNSPQLGEKQPLPWCPVTFRDWAGHVLVRVYTDEYGRYNALVPSTFSANAPSPSGFAPNVLTVTINDRGPIPDPDNPGSFIDDPYYDPQFSQFTYTLQFMPGQYTVLDTPVVPVGAFAGPDRFPLDCQPVDGTPCLYQVSGSLGGPYVSSTGQTLTIQAVGPVSVANPAYGGPGSLDPKTILRDYGFGNTPGTVTLDGVPLTNVSWSSSQITATVPGGAHTGQLIVKRGDNGFETDVGITVTVGAPAGSVHVVMPSAIPGATPIQDAIDAADPGDLLLVQPGFYEESVVLWKPVHLQGAGEYSTILNGIQAPSEKLVAWRARVEALIANQQVDLLPGVTVGFVGVEPTALATEEGAGILVLAKDAAPADGGFGLVGGQPNARIDGFTIGGVSQGGGIVVNGYVKDLPISNNRVVGNAGSYGGGIRSGHPLLQNVDANGNTISQPCFNENLSIHHNRVLENGGLTAAGGGIALFSGTTGYEVRDNVVCGNYTVGEGAGIAHLGLSDGGRIEGNLVLFNQSFDQGTTVSGGGILVGGTPPPAPAAATGPGTPLAVSEGSGSVVIKGNVIQGNNAGAGNGGGIRLSRVNGLDLASTNPADWYTVDVVNNVIASNVAGLAGGGVSVQDAVRVNIVHNTVVDNDATATAGEAFAPNSVTRSIAQPAGIVGHVHTMALSGILGSDPVYDGIRGFSNPRLVNDIVWHNRSFHFEIAADGTAFGLVPDVSSQPPQYWDLQVLGTMGGERLSPENCVLTSTAGYASSNVSGDPLLTSSYVNGDQGQTILMPEINSSLNIAVAFDEGGNFIDVRYGPLTPWNAGAGRPYLDGHLQDGSSALAIGSSSVLALVPEASVDIDGDPRTTDLDAGADETSFSGGPGPDPTPTLSIASSNTGPNSLSATGGDEGQLTRFYWALQPGSTAVNGGPCGGTQLLLQSPRLLGSARTENGVATLSIDVPGRFAGRTLYFQALHRNCTTTQLLQVQF